MQSPDIVFDAEVTEILMALGELGLGDEELMSLSFKPRDIGAGAHAELLLKDAVRRVLFGLVDAGYGSMSVAFLLNDPGGARAQASPRDANQEEMDIRLHTQHEVAPRLIYRSKLNR